MLAEASAIVNDPSGTEAGVFSIANDPSDMEAEVFSIANDPSGMEAEVFSIINNPSGMKDGGRASVPGIARALRGLLPV
jgi:hypothetical protein